MLPEPAAQSDLPRGPRKGGSAVPGAAGSREPDGSGVPSGGKGWPYCLDFQPQHDCEREWDGGHVRYPVGCYPAAAGGGEIAPVPGTS